MKILLYLVLLFGGAIVGFFVAAVCAISTCSDCAEVQRQREGGIYENPDDMR